MFSSTPLVLERQRRGFGTGMTSHDTHHSRRLEDLIDFKRLKNEANLGEA
jgi:hypothetical protein